MPPELLLHLYFFGVMIFAPNSPTSPDSMHLYIPKIVSGDRCMTHLPFLAFEAAECGNYCKKNDKLCICPLEGQEITIEPIWSPVVHHLRQKPTGPVPLTATEGSDLEWLVNLRNVVSGSRINTKALTSSRLAGRLWFSWDSAQVCELAKVTIAQKAPIVRSYEFVPDGEKTGSNLQQSIAEAVLFESHLPFAPQVTIGLSSSGGRVTIKLPCAQRVCSIAFVNSRFDECDHGGEKGGDFLHYYDFLLPQPTKPPVPQSNSNGVPDGQNPECGEPYPRLRDAIQTYLAGKYKGCTSCPFCPPGQLCPESANGRPICPMAMMNE